MAEHLTAAGAPAADAPDVDPVTRSFELAAERCDDLTGLVYARLFAAHPGLRDLFVLDRDDGVKGSMLEWTIRALLDMADGQPVGLQVIRAEAVNHERNGVTPDQFPLFFRALADTVRELLGPQWSPAMQAAWQALLDRLAAGLQDL